MQRCNLFRNTPGNFFRIPSNWWWEGINPFYFSSLNPQSEIQVYKTQFRQIPKTLRQKHKSLEAEMWPKDSNLTAWQQSGPASNQLVSSNWKW